MRFIVFLYLISGLIGCSDLSSSTRQYLEDALAEEISVNNSGDGNFDFKMKLPEGYDLLDGKPAPANDVPILSDSPYIKFECNGTDKGTNRTQINVGLKNLSTSKNYVARFQYICAEGAKLRLVKLVSNEKYQLSIHVINQNGVIFHGQSDVFTTASEKIVIKLYRIQRNDDLDVEIIFPSDPKPVAKSVITCNFVGKEVAVKMPAPDAGNLENDIVTTGPGGSCSVSRVGIDPFPLPTSPTHTANTPVKAPQTCVTSGPSCTISLDVLQSAVMYKISLSSKACPNSNVPYRLVTLRPGQNTEVYACKDGADPEPPKPNSDPCLDGSLALKIGEGKILSSIVPTVFYGKSNDYKTNLLGILYYDEHLSPGIGGYIAKTTRICHLKDGKYISTWITGDTPEITNKIKALIESKDRPVAVLGTNKSAPMCYEGCALPIESISELGSSNPDPVPAPLPKIVKIKPNKIVSATLLPGELAADVIVSFNLLGCLDKLGKVSFDTVESDGKLSLYVAGENILNPESTKVNCIAVPTAQYKIRAVGKYPIKSIWLNNL